MSEQIQSCVICGGNLFVSKKVLWASLVEEWELSPDEVQWIDRQQGTHCRDCGCNLRSLALAKAVMSAANYQGIFKRYLRSPKAWTKRVLEINEAGSLSPYLNRLPRRTLASYPQIDMQRLAYPNSHFDLVLHSDTLEHIPDPLVGLKECLRVLRPGGWCCFTIPIIPGRMTRSRVGLRPSFHGSISTRSSDFQVQTEYGSDCWEQVMQAGFEECRIVSAEYPSALALAARRSN